MTERKKGPIPHQLKEYLPAELSERERGRMQMLGSEVARVYAEKMLFYRQQKERYTEDEWTQQRYGTPELRHTAATQPAPDSHYERALTIRADELSWSDLQEVFERSQEAGIALWEGVLSVAEARIAGGLFARDALGVVDVRMFEAAQFIVIRDSFVDAWQPKDAIEMSMVEMLVQSYLSYHHWLRRANSMAEREYDAAEQNADKRTRNGEREQWHTPRVSVADAIDRAMATADRFNRMYLRILRQMRDLRRYALPVIVNNGGQVNVAADGGQQKNVQKKPKKATKAKPQGSATVPDSRRLKAVK